MNVIDSSAWLEYLAGAKNAAFFAKAIENVKDLIVPTLTLYEVYKCVARLSLKHRLPMADSIILATARSYDATLWTQDSDFEHIRGVKYVKAMPTRA
jgi:predicted nucleic acid-binding protein